MGTTLNKIKNLEQIYIDGYGDDFMDRALDKLLAQQRAEDEASLRVLRADLEKIGTEIQHDLRHVCAAISPGSHG